MSPLPAHTGAEGNDDAELVRRITDDDSGALKVLFERYYPALCRFSLTIVKHTESAEETVADVFAELWLKRGSIRIHTSVRSYLYGAVRNRSLNAIRSSGLATEPLDTLAAEPSDPSFDADTLLQYNELVLSVDELIDRLPERRRLIFRMNRIDGLSYQEIADILTLSVYTIQNQMVEAVKFLARNYQP